MQKEGIPSFILHSAFFIPIRRARVALLLAFWAGALVLGWALGWKALEPRWSQLAKDHAAREAMYAQARQMAADSPVFGTGPGTFAAVFSLYRISTDTYWPAQAHNDWLETRITFGWVGSALISLALATVLLRWFLPGGFHGGRRFVVLTWLALAGCGSRALRFSLPDLLHPVPVPGALRHFVCPHASGARTRYPRLALSHELTE